MGILGQNENPFLADRIFEVFVADQGKDDELLFESFVRIMDILCNGTEEERH